MDDIAARAHLTKRALYQHFPSKDNLIAAALAHSSELACDSGLRDKKRRNLRGNGVLLIEKPSRLAQVNLEAKSLYSSIL